MGQNQGKGADVGLLAKGYPVVDETDLRGICKFTLYRPGYGFSFFH
jgi:hypothetical protein